MYGEHCISACSHPAFDICSLHTTPLFLTVGDNSYVYHCNDFISNPDSIQYIINLHGLSKRDLDTNGSGNAVVSSAWGNVAVTQPIFIAITAATFFYGLSF